MPFAVPFAADFGFSFADTWAVGFAFLGIAVFAAIGALSHEQDRAFSASMFYLGFGLVAAHVPDPALAEFYRELTQSEARHAGLFVRLARGEFSDAEVDARLEQLYDLEADVVASLPVRAALH